MRRAAQNYSGIAGTPARLVFGPFFAGDFLEELRIEYQAGTVTAGDTVSVEMVASQVDAVGSGEQLQNAPLLLPIMSASRFACIIHLNEFVQADKPWLLVNITTGDIAATTGFATVKRRPGRLGKRAE